VKLASLALAVCLAAIGCDTYYGIIRTSTAFSPTPVDACVVDAIRSIDGMTHVSSQLESGGRRLTWHGLQRPDEIHRFLYEYRGLRSGFYLLVTSDGAAQLHQSYGGLNRIPPQKDVDTIYPALLTIEVALQRQCGADALGSKIKQLCSGVRCDGV
jgi:hypothetical protein